MKKNIALFIILLTVCLGINSEDQKVKEPTKNGVCDAMGDRDLIKQTVLDYVEGWYGADGQRMDNALYSKLSKRRITPEGEAWEATKEWMVDATKKGQGRIEHPETGKKDITILDMTRTMASVKLVSEAFDDYIQLAKVSGKWVIVNALWDYR
jgi:hypothetical protein